MKRNRLLFGTMLVVGAAIAVALAQPGEQGGPPDGGGPGLGGGLGMMGGPFMGMRGARRGASSSLPLRSTCSWSEATPSSSWT